MAAYGYGSKLRCQTGNFWKVGTTWSICNLQPVGGLAQKFTSSGLKCLTWLVDRMHFCRSLCLWRMLALEAANGFCVRLWWWLCRMARLSLMPSNHQITLCTQKILGFKLQQWQHQTTKPSMTILSSPGQSFGSVWTWVFQQKKNGAFFGGSNRCVSITGST